MTNFAIGVIFAMAMVKGVGRKSSFWPLHLDPR